MATRRRVSRPAIEAALVLVALLLMLAAATAGFLVGRETASGDGATAAETTGETETSATTDQTTTAGTGTETDTETEAETETEGGGDDDVDGAAVFASAGCGSCHTFEPANASGTVGPDLGDTDLSKEEIEQVVRNGRGGMPAFEGRLSDAEIEAVADFVESG